MFKYPKLNYTNISCFRANFNFAYGCSKVKGLLPRFSELQGFKIADPRFIDIYSHLSNNYVGWNKRGGSEKVAKSINVEVGIKVEGGIFWKKLVHKSNKRGVEGRKI